MDRTPRADDAAIVERYRSARRDPGLAVLEGFHALKHAVRFGAEVLDVRAADMEGIRELCAVLAPDVLDMILDLARPMDRERFNELAPSPHPTGIIALARQPVVDIEMLLGSADLAPIVLLDRPTHHGNIGAVIRVAAAAGAAGVLVTGPHDPWHPAAIRGAAGLHFALPVLRLQEEGLQAVEQSGRPVVALDPDGEPLRRGQRRLRPGTVLVFGSERTGVSAGLLKRVDALRSIPMRAGVSSLNLATAVAITLYLGSEED